VLLPAQITSSVGADRNSIRRQSGTIVLPFVASGENLSSEPLVTLTQRRRGVAETSWHGEPPRNTRGPAWRSMPSSTRPSRPPTLSESVRRVSSRAQRLSSNDPPGQKIGRWRSDHLGSDRFGRSPVRTNVLCDKGARGILGPQEVSTAARLTVTGLQYERYAHVLYRTSLDI